jgi:hypothetical protein
MVLDGSLVSLHFICFVFFFIGRGEEIHRKVCRETFVGLSDPGLH